MTRKPKASEIIDLVAIVCLLIVSALLSVINAICQAY